ncbi:15-hydroxyprostaglandin dehydrogenase [NAD(+)]-like [Lingula anatina]|uniref:15-hydroxyprostaglandin dehydrogenase [NAD(+)] n=1 Tax=Lingula anatina TaxID=7574 RepID=A0A1S3K7K8_LINAN|nr:15-hydroxyprostaglandin dehydrogenase [NAD(+)]-like [Lingula anatina]|eukprot:XP_013418615.1 15-hydroxyprostaglandin dehydrogenase [NAD(+)]-like [Lingula anatina]
MGKIQQVTIADIDETNGSVALNKLATQHGEENVTFIKCDVTKDAKIRDALMRTKSKFGRLDVIMNNAGIMNEKDFELLININLTAVIRGTTLGLKHLRKDQGGNGGVILNTASVSGLKPSFCNPVYGASKHGVVGYTRSLASSLSPSMATHGVRVNCLCPDFTDTPMVRSLESADSVSKRGIHHAEKLSDYVCKNIDGMLKASVVAESAIKLLADDSKNGAAMIVTGRGVAFIDPPEHPFFTDKTLE